MVIRHRVERQLTALAAHCERGGRCDIRPGARSFGADPGDARECSRPLSRSRPAHRVAQIFLLLPPARDLQANPV